MSNAKQRSTNRTPTQLIPHPERLHREKETSLFILNWRSPITDRCPASLFRRREIVECVIAVIAQWERRAVESPSLSRPRVSQVVGRDRVLMELLIGPCEGVPKCSEKTRMTSVRPTIERSLK